MDNIKILDNPFHKLFEFFCSNIFSSTSYKKYDEFLISEIIDTKYSDMLIKKKYLILENDKIYLNFQNEFISSYKKTYDIYKFQLLNYSTQEEIINVRDSILNEFKNRITSIILIGSAARNKLTLESDLDIIVVADDRIKKRLRDKLQVYKIEIQSYTKENFDYLFNENEEIILWAIKYGLILYDNNFIFKYYYQNKLNIGHRTIMNKRKLIEMLISDITNNLDIPLSRIKFKIDRFVYQCARLFLIMQDIMPLSRNEIADQIEKFSPILAEKIKSYKIQRNASKNELVQFFYEYKELFTNEMKKI